MNDFLQLIHVCDFDVQASDEYAVVRTYLEAKGQSIGSLDTLIAAHALSLKLTLVTNNVRELKRAPKLKIENWAK